MRPRRFRRGKRYGRPRHAARREAASMRPRRFRRGKRGRPAPPPPRRSVGFNEAPAIPPGKTGSGVPAWRSTSSASMRPRRFRRGKPTRSTALHVSKRKASMRPRRFRRGKPGPAVSKRRLVFRLQ